MKVLVISSCSSLKTVDHPLQLTWPDFEAGPFRVKQRERELQAHLTAAERLYNGMQHRRLMQGVVSARQPGSFAGVELKILSAGYGLISSSQIIAPYDATLGSLSGAELSHWSAQMEIPEKFQQTVAGSYDLCLVLLGSKYLEACKVEPTIEFSAPTIFLTSKHGAARLSRQVPQATAWALENTHAQRLRCPLVGIKGEIARRILLLATSGKLSQPPRTLNEIIDASESQGNEMPGW